MAISSDNTKLYIDRSDPNNPVGITLGEMMKCLGYYKRDTNGKRNLGMIIKNADINKWSKHKWVRSTSTSPLTEAERKNASGNGDGTYLYGVRVRFSSTKLDEVHDSGFDYARPTGAPYLFRIGDGDGYDHKAKPDVNYSLGFSTIYRDLSTGSETDIDNQDSVYIDVDYQGINTTGLPIKGIIGEALGMGEGTADSQIFSQVYPFILVDGYLCAMGNYLQGGAVTPLYYQDSWYNRFIASFGKLHNTHGLELGNAKVSVLLVGTFSNDSLMTEYLDGEWHSVTGLDEVVLSRPFYPCPPETGRLLEVKDFGSPIPAMNLSVSVADENGFYINVGYSSEPQEDIIINFTVRVVSPTNIGTSRLVYTDLAGGQLQLSPYFSWTKADISQGGFGLGSAPADGTEIVANISASYRYASEPMRVREATASVRFMVDYDSPISPESGIK